MKNTINNEIIYIISIDELDLPTLSLYQFGYISLKQVETALAKLGLRLKN